MRTHFALNRLNLTSSHRQLCHQGLSYYHS